MSIRIISSGGKLVGYQAIGGSGKAGLSKYFSALMPGALDAASEMVAALERKAALQCKTKNPLRGLRITQRPSRDADRPPLLYA